MASTCNAEPPETSVEEPDLVGHVLASLRLGVVDLARLDADERMSRAAEMMAAMCAAEVTLRDWHRFRLRLGGARQSLQAHPLPHNPHPQRKVPADLLGQLRRSRDTDKEEDAPAPGSERCGHEGDGALSPLFGAPDTLTIGQCVQGLTTFSIIGGQSRQCHPMHSIRWKTLSC